MSSVYRFCVRLAILLLAIGTKSGLAVAGTFEVACWREYFDRTAIAGYFNDHDAQIFLFDEYIRLDDGDGHLYKMQGSNSSFKPTPATSSDLKARYGVTKFAAFFDLNPLMTSLGKGHKFPTVVTFEHEKTRLAQNWGGEEGFQATQDRLDKQDIRIFKGKTVAEAHMNCVVIKELDAMPSVEEILEEYERLRNLNYYESIGFFDRCYALLTNAGASLFRSLFAR